MKRKTKVFLFVTILFIVVTLVTGMVYFRFYMNSFREVENDAHYDQYYVMITESRKSSFWQSVYQGAYERGLEENVYVELLGDNLSQDYSREDLMQIAISSGVDGIIVSADESEDMVNLINQAADAGIPVVTLYGDNTHSSRCSFVGVGSYNLGREYGKQVLRIANEKLRSEALKSSDEKQQSSMKVAVLVNSYAQDSGQNILITGIQETLESEGNIGAKIETSLVSVDDTNAFSVEESIRDIMMEGQLPDIIICLNELNTTCVYQAVVDYNKVGQVNILGYYDSDTILNAIDRSVIYSTVSIDTRQMGRYCVDALTEYNALGYTSQYFTADIAFINKENVSLYLGGDEQDVK